MFFKSRKPQCVTFPVVHRDRRLAMNLMVKGLTVLLLFVIFPHAPGVAG
jgi:hypothetical protein